MIKIGKINKKQFKKIFLAVLVGLLVATAIKVMVTNPTQVLADSLMKFDEGYGTSTRDSNAVITAGTITNAVWKSDELCYIGKCLFFDGSGDLVSYTDDASLDMGSAETVTIEGWFRSFVTGATRTLVAKEESAGADGGYRIELNTSGQLVFGIDDDNGSFPADGITSTAAYDNGQWHHFAAVKDGNTSISLYVDGISVGSDTSIISDASNDDTFYLGMYNGATSPMYGFIDEIKVLRTARSALEVKADFAGQTPGRGVAASIEPSNSYLSDQMTGYWKLDEASDATRVDFSGIQNDLTESASDTVAQAAGKFSYTADFERGDTEYMEIVDANQFGLDFSNSFTFSAWLNVESTAGNYEGIIGKTSASGFAYAWGTRTSDKMVVAIDDDGTAGGDVEIETAASAFSLATWTHFVVTYDGAYIRLYKNGAEYIGGNFPYATNLSIFNSSSAFRIGNWENQTGYYDGLLDDVRVYSKALNPDEIQTLYNWTPGPLLHWKFDENDGTAANDSSGLDKGGTLTNAPTWAKGKIGSDLRFAAGNAHVIRADDSDLDFGVGASFSYGAWIKHGTASALEMIIDKYESTSGLGGFKLYMESDGDLTCGIDDDQTSFPEDSATSTAATYDDGKWHYIMCVKDGVSGLHLYIDGVLIISDAGGISSTSDFANTDPLYVGIAEDAAANDWVGEIDDVKIYGYARSGQQVVEDMNATHPAPGSPVGSAIAYWRFDDGYGTTAQDQRDNNNDLTLNTASWDNEGKYGKAWNGTGGAIRASRTTDADLEFSATDSFTLSVWHRSDGADDLGVIEYLMADGGPAGSAGYAVYANATGDLCFGIDDDTSWGPDVEACSDTTQDYYDQTWHHITAVRNVPADTISIYIDGILNATSSDTTSATLDSSPTFYIGDIDTDDAGSGEELAGDIDEVKVFRFALTNDQIKVLYNLSSSVVMGAISTDALGNPSWSSEREYCPPGNTETNCADGLNPAPTGEWKLDDNGSTSVVDTSGNNITATLGVGTTSPAWIPGIKGSALNFDNVDDTVNMADITSLDVVDGEDFTLTGWFNSSTIADDGVVAGKKVGQTTGAGYNVYVNDADGKILAPIGDGTDYYLVESVTGVTVGNWYYFALVWDDDSEAGTKLYINGKQDVTTICSGSPAGCTTTIGDIATLTNTANFRLGSVSNGTGIPFGGKVDNIRLYKYIRTANQIAWEYNEGKPQGEYRFDENTGTTTNDASGNAYHSQTFTGGTTWVTGKINTALTFDGTDDNVRVTEGFGIDMGETTHSNTVSAWIKTSADLSTNGTIIAKDDGSGAYPFSLYLNTAEQACFQISDGTQSPSTCTTTTLNDDTWHHILGKRDVIADTISIYVDGNLINSTTDTTTVTTANDDNVSFGNSGTSYTANDFNGVIDEAKIFPYALTQQQILMVRGEGALRFD